jgi:signal transduction histidine kinase
MIIISGYHLINVLKRERTVELTKINEQLRQEIIERNRVEESLQQRNQELALLNRIGQMFSSSIELDQVLVTILSEMRQLLNIVAASFWLGVPETEELVCRQAVGTGSETVIGWRLALGQGIVGQAAQTGEIILVADSRTDRQHYKGVDQKTGIELRSILSIPFRAKGQVIGVLNLVDTAVDRFTEDDLRFVEQIAAAAARAVENARLYTIAQQEITERKRAEAELLVANKELKETLEHLKQTQRQLIVSEKMAALGHLIAGVAHEINTPLGAIRASIENITATLDQTLIQLPEFFRSISEDRQHDFFALLTKALHKNVILSTREERQRRHKLIEELQAYHLQNEQKISRILVNLGVYENIQPFLPLLQDPDHEQILTMAYRLAGLQESTHIIAEAIDRAAKVMFALKTYARYDQSGKMIEANLSEGIETVLTLYQSQMKHGVELIRKYEALQPILCYPDELNQVWTNLLQNALQAMDYKGTLTITIGKRGEQAVISIADTGTGIPDEIKERIFEPFFTTKPQGEGSGLGLDIVKNIIEKHQGKITVETKPGHTTFSVWLPIRNVMHET